MTETVDLAKLLTLTAQPRPFDPAHGPLARPPVVPGTRGLLTPTVTGVRRASGARYAL